MVWLRAFCSVWELVIEFIEVVRVCKKLCTFHRICARFTEAVHVLHAPPNNVPVQLLWNGRLSLGALNQTTGYIYIYVCVWYIYMYMYVYIHMCVFPIYYICTHTHVYVYPSNSVWECVYSHSQALLVQPMTNLGCSQRLGVERILRLGPGWYPNVAGQWMFIHVYSTKDDNRCWPISIRPSDSWTNGHLGNVITANKLGILRTGKGWVVSSSWPAFKRPTSCA